MMDDVGKSPAAERPAAAGKDASKQGRQLEEQARETARKQDKKRNDFATGKKRFTDGK